MSLVSINVAALDEVAGKPAPRDLFIDAEPRNGQWEIVVRGRDVCLAGSGSKQRKPCLAFNDATGASHRFVVATVSGEGARERAEQLVSALRAFHNLADKPLAERMPDDAEFFKLAIIIGQSIGVAPYCTMSSRSVGSFNDSHAAKSAARAAAKQAAATATAIAVVATAPGKVIEAMPADDLDAMLQAIQQRKAALATAK